MLAILFIARVTMGFQYQAVAALSPLFADSFGIGLADLGILVGLYMSPGVVVALPGAAIGKLFGDKRVVSFGMILMIIGGLIMAFGWNYPLQLTGRVVAGAGGVILNVLMAKMVTDYFSGREISLAMGIFANSWPVGIAAALLVLPLVGNTAGLSWAMLTVAIFILIGLLLFYSMYVDVAQAGVKSAGKFKISGTALIALLLAGIIWAFYNAGLAMIFAFAPIFLLEKGWSLLSANSTTSIVLWLAVISIPIGGYLADRTGKKDLIILGSLTTFAILLPLSAHTEFVISIYILMGLFAGLAAGPIMGLPSEVLTPENRGIGIGIFLSLFYVGVVLAPILAGALLETTGNPGVAFYLGSVLLMLGCLAQLAFRFLAKRVILSSTN
jgi:MFS family permease|tara:strand:- start:404 stop:1555 length:1152 start_codon:yes stop_codon:yes gene_type:complete